MQRLSHSLFQESQQQRTLQAEEGGGGAEPQKGRARRPAPKPLQASLTFPSKESPPASSSDFRSYSRSISLLGRSLQSRAASNRARYRDGETTSASQFYKSTSKPGSSSLVWRSPSGRSPSSQLLERSPEASMTVFGERAEESQSYMPAPTPSTVTTTESGESEVSSIAYIAIDRRKDLRLFKRIPLPARLAKRPASPSSEHSSFTRRSPMIIEDTQDALTSALTGKEKSMSLNKTARRNAARSTASTSSSVTLQPFALHALKLKRKSSRHSSETDAESFIRPTGRSTTERSKRPIARSQPVLASHEHGVDPYSDTEAVWSSIDVLESSAARQGSLPQSSLEAGEISPFCGLGLDSACLPEYATTLSAPGSSDLSLSKDMPAELPDHILEDLTSTSPLVPAQASTVPLSPWQRLQQSIERKRRTLRKMTKLPKLKKSNKISHVQGSAS